MDHELIFRFSDNSDIKQAWLNDDEILSQVPTALLLNVYSIIEHLERRKMRTVINNVLEWSSSKNLFTASDQKTQMLKCVSEIGELADNVAKSRDIKDDIGDVLVTLINVARFDGLDIQECLEHAYEEIKDRKGKFINGTFIKEGDK